jgi:hypothetical protein
MNSIRCRFASAFAILAGLAILAGSAIDVGRAERAGASTSPVGGSAAATIVHFAGGMIRVDFDPAQFTLTRAELHAWVRDSARATTAYFGRFPVPYARLIVEPTRGQQVTMGSAVGRPEPRIVVKMGRHTTAAELATESLLVHEMVHLAVPDHDLRFLWLHEGIATYVEHVARAQAGLMPVTALWAELMRELPEGLPEPRSTDGLDDTPSDRRRYWGGALFCLIADIEIRKATGNRLGLQDALRALQRQGGNLSRMWSLERTIEVADGSVGAPVLATLYARMGPRADAPDLARLWRELGVRQERGRIVLDDRAPLAAIRRAITDQPSAPLLVSQPRLVRIAPLQAAAVPR